MLATGRLTAAALTCGAAILLFAVHVRPLGYVPLVAGVLLGLVLDRRLGRDLGLIALGMAIVSAIPLKADLSDAGMLRFTVALSLAVLVPWALSKYVFKDDDGAGAVRFPVATGVPWTRGQWLYLGVVVLVGYLLLPWYFLSSGAYLNWPTLEDDGDIARLFVGVNAVGIWTSCSSSAPCSRCCAGTSGSRSPTCSRPWCSCRSCGSSATASGGRR